VTEPLRYELVRTGRRFPLEPYLSRAVFERDKCQKCPLCGMFMERGESVEVDHVVPWSAGGENVTSNLRLTHKECNQKRSNFYHPSDAKPIMPVTPKCQACLGVLFTDDDDPVLAYCLTCEFEEYAERGALW
jgi:hypothetical protein